MNKERRKRIGKALELIQQAKDILESAKGEEETCRDNLPEGLQESKLGEQMDSNVEVLEEIIGTLEDAESYWEAV